MLKVLTAKATQRLLLQLQVSVLCRQRRARLPAWCLGPRRAACFALMMLVGLMLESPGQPRDVVVAVSQPAAGSVLPFHCTSLPLTPCMQELDLFKAQWLNNYCSSHPPSEGNKVRRQ